MGLKADNSKPQCRLSPLCGTANMSAGESDMVADVLPSNFESRCIRQHLSQLPQDVESVTGAFDLVYLQRCGCFAMVNGWGTASSGYFPPMLTSFVNSRQVKLQAFWCQCLINIVLTKTVRDIPMAASLHMMSSHHTKVVQHELDIQ